MIKQYEKKQQKLEKVASRNRLESNTAAFSRNNSNDNISKLVFSEFDNTLHPEATG